MQVRLTVSKPVLKAHVVSALESLKLSYDMLPSTFSFKLNLRRYIWGMHSAQAGALTNSFMMRAAFQSSQAGAYTLPLLSST